ncbi:hemolysin D [Candidatus Magnetomorum sp. HK-1]|nr:hemolysin D [Candidatus Magnetomorum sp. HK-1]
MKQKGIFITILCYFLLLPSIGLAIKEKDQQHDIKESTIHSDNHMMHENKNDHDDHDTHHDHDAHAQQNSEKNDNFFDDLKEYENNEKDKIDDHDDHDDHKGHEHAMQINDFHAGHDHEDSNSVELTKRGIKFAGLTFDIVSKKIISKSIELPGEIGFNEDRVAHITPRYPGIVKKVNKNLGQKVKKGQLLAVVENNDSLTTYNILAPIAGQIVEKHLLPGEFVGEDSTLFVIADLSTVWVNCDVYAKDADYVYKGQKILIQAVGTNRKLKTSLSYVAPVYNTITRSMIVRAEISNIDGKWRPGTFITGQISVATDKPVLVVSNEAVQVLDGESIVFVPSKFQNSFEPFVVKKGIENNQYVEILSGLSEGDAYVSKGAFELKAKIVTNALGGHAGHGH